MSEPYVLKTGATGAILTATLKSNKLPVDLTGYTVKLTLKRGSDSAVILEGTCTVDPDQVTNKGKVHYSFATTASIPKGTYNAEFEATDVNGRDHKFPSSIREPYKRVIVQQSLS
jgi:hypothetical protein